MTRDALCVTVKHGGLSILMTDDSCIVFNFCRYVQRTRWAGIGSYNVYANVSRYLQLKCLSVFKKNFSLLRAGASCTAHVFLCRSQCYKQLSDITSICEPIQSTLRAYRALYITNYTRSQLYSKPASD